MAMIRVKAKKQIGKIRKSCQLAALTLKYLEPFVVPGVTTEELDFLADEFIRKAGAIPACLGYKGFPKSVCISVNEVVCHGIPGPRKLADGDIVNIDVTTILEGYFGDTSRMYEVGTVSEDAKRLLQVAKECLDVGIKAVMPGGRLGMIGHEISTHAHRNGFSVVEDYCGHGVGLAFHEEPTVSHVSGPLEGPVLKPGFIFTIEPMINEGDYRCITEADGWTATTFDHKLSAQYEHTVLVTKKGVEILTVVEDMPHLDPRGPSFAELLESLKI
jgi:methionyl aminopeptidase